MQKTAFVMPHILLAALLFPAIAVGKNQENPEKVSLQLQWKHQFEFAGFYAAKEKGYYAEAGLEVEIREYQQGKDIIGSVLFSHQRSLSSAKEKGALQYHRSQQLWGPIL